jgi:hypothetical protein
MPYAPKWEQQEKERERQKLNADSIWYQQVNGISKSTQQLLTTTTTTTTTTTATTTKPHAQMDM